MCQACSLLCICCFLCLEPLVPLTLNGLLPHTNQVFASLCLCPERPSLATSLNSLPHSYSRAPQSATAQHTPHFIVDVVMCRSAPLAGRRNAHRLSCWECRHHQLTPETLSKRWKVSEVCHFLCQRKLLHQHVRPLPGGSLQPKTGHVGVQMPSPPISIRTTLLVVPSCKAPQEEDRKQLFRLSVLRPSPFTSVAPEITPPKTSCKSLCESLLPAEPVLWASTPNYGVFTYLLTLTSLFPVSLAKT